MIRIGVIGLGWWGKQIVTCLAGSSRFKVVASCDIDQAMAAPFAATHGVDLIADYRDMLKRPDIDAVAVVTPHLLHEEMAIAGFAAGKQVFCEKPLARHAPAGAWTALGIHLGDMFVSLAGKPARVAARTASQIFPAPSEDFISAEIDFDNGARGRITCLSTPPFYGRFTLFGDQGWVETQEGGNVDKGIPSSFMHCKCRRRTRNARLRTYQRRTAEFRSLGRRHRRPRALPVRPSNCSRTSASSMRSFVRRRMEASRLNCDIDALSTFRACPRPSFAPNPRTYRNPHGYIMPPPATRL